MPDQSAWERLGALLVARRVELGHTKRLTWARDVLGLTHDRTQSDLENARRTNYDAATLAQVEQQYMWSFGSIQRVLAGGNPEPLDVGAARGLRYQAPADHQEATVEYLRMLQSELYRLDVEYYELSAERAKLQAEIHSVEDELRRSESSSADESVGPLDAALDQLEDEREEAPPLGGLRSVPVAALDSDAEDSVERRRREQDDNN